MKSDSQSYIEKKSFYQKLLTVYGRKPVMEALQDKQLKIHRLHLAESNKPTGIIKDIVDAAMQREVEVVYHNRQSLSRISKNSKQDQGVAADVHMEKSLTLDEFLSQTHGHFRLLALDSITNPQNVGMIIRSACAGNIDGIVIPEKGCASLSPLVIKASAGTVFKAPILRCNSLIDALKALQQHSAEICVLSSHAKQSLFDCRTDQSAVYVLGNETDGVSKAVFELSDRQIMIPMNNGVESLNVAITAALIAFSNGITAAPLISKSH